MAVHRYSDGDNITLQVNLSDPSTGAPLTGQTVEVALQRYVASKGGAALDGFYWDGATGFAAPLNFETLVEVNAVDLPGRYELEFPNASIANLHQYRAYYRIVGGPAGGLFAVDTLIVTDELFIPSTSPAIPILPGDTVMGRLADMENSTGPVALANADAVWDEPIADHQLPGSTGEALFKCTIGGVGSNQVTFTIEDQTATPISGVQFDLYDSTNTIFLLRTITDINGQVVLALDDGTFNVRLFASGVAFTVPEVAVVNTDPQSFTFSGTTTVTVSVPSAPDLCVIFGTLRDAAGQPLVGACVQAFANPLPTVVAGTQVADPLAEVLTDNNGFFELELVRNTPVRFSIAEANIDYLRTVPDAPSQDLTTWT